MAEIDAKTAKPTEPDSPEAWYVEQHVCVADKRSNETSSLTTFLQNKKKKEEQTTDNPDNFQ